MIKPTFMKLLQPDLDRNFQELTKFFSQMSDIAASRPVISVALVAGDNPVVPNTPNPVGRIVVFQSAASSLFDKGMSNGRWIINASAPCNVKLTFF